MSNQTETTTEMSKLTWTEMDEQLESGSASQALLMELDAYFQGADCGFDSDDTEYVMKRVFEEAEDERWEREA